MSILDPSSTFDDFPEFDLHHHFPPTSHGLPHTSDLDLDLDLELDFSVDDLLLPSSSPSDDEADPPQHSDPHPPSPESANSAVINHDSEAKDHGRTTLKRKADREGDVSPNPNPNARICKVRSSSSAADPVEGNSSESTFTPGGEGEGGGGGSEEEEKKRKARLMRNRESAQLSRQRKKHYVEELEDKVRAMSSTIADLNGKISFYMSENARLHHQLTGANAVATANPTLPPPAAAAATTAPAFPPPPLPMHFPWIPYAGYPHHPMRPNGAPVPLVAIPRLKPQQPAPAAKCKKSESRRTGGGGEGKGRTKKLACVSLVGILIFVFLVFGGGRDAAMSGEGRVLSVSGVRRSNKGLNNSTEAKLNSSESIPALLYVPRNGRHVEINGNLIIHSVLASERAMAEAKSGKRKSEGKEGTGLAIPPRGLASAALAVPESERDLGRHPKAYLNAAERVRALGSKPQDALKSTPADGPLQQWFREGLAGPILSSGTCTEVFQFEVSPSSSSPSGGIVSATSVINATNKLPPGMMKNRRILYPHAIPLTGSNINDTHQFGKPTENKSNFHSNSTVPSMVVSVMADPREAGDGDGDGMITPKSLSRIFVVVLMDSVKYVTYSCVLPLKSYGPHLVN